MTIVLSNLQHNARNKGALNSQSSVLEQVTNKISRRINSMF